MSDNQTKMFQVKTSTRMVASLALMATFAGCAAPIGVAGFMKAEPTFVRLSEERAFAQSLRQRYLELATNAYDRGDYDRSDFYSLRAIMAVEGKLADPGQVAGHVDPELGNIRNRLQGALMSGMRINAPDLAARAQAAYDCWLLEAQAGDPAIAEACRNNAFQAIAELENVGVGTRIASVTEAQQIVVNGETPSQTYQAGGTAVEVISAQDYAGYQQQQPIQHRQALARTRTIETEPMRAEASRAYMEAPQQTYLPRETVPAMPEPFVPQSYASPQAASFRTDESFEPVDLGPINLVPAPFFLPESEPQSQFDPQSQMQGVIETVPMTGPMNGQYAPVQENIGGQYAVVEGSIPMVDLGTSEFQSSMRPIYDAEEMPRFAAIPQSPVYADSAVYARSPGSQIALTNVSGDVMSALVEARQSGSSDYSVFFGFDSDQITPEGEDVLIDTVEKLILEDRQTVSLMGFTDSAGDSRYNQLLAMRRANAVRQYIQNKTDRTVNFEIMPVGEIEAVRNGGDGVIEALNRRVEIKVR